MPWLSVNQTRLSGLSAVPTPVLALEVQRPGCRASPALRVGQPSVRLPYRRAHSITDLISSGRVLAEGRGEIASTGWRCVISCAT